MLVILLLTTAAVVARSDSADADTGIKGYFSSRQHYQGAKNDKHTGVEAQNRNWVSLPRDKFSVLNEALMEEVGAIKTKEEVAQRPQAITSTSEGYDQCVDKSTSKINSVTDDEQALLQSDIVMTKRKVEQTLKDGVSDNRSKRQVLKDYGNKTVIWSDGVFYTFNTPSRIIQKAFKMGVKVWTDNTCIDFIEDKNAKDKVTVVKTDMCSSAIGRLGGNQHLCLSEDDTAVGTIVHEIGHLLGLFHTTARYDRDNFVTVVFQNVDPRLMKNFGKVNRTTADVFGLSYDYGSIMHYEDTSGTINDQPTLIAKNPLYQLTMGSPMISFSDIFMINKRYGCDAKCNKSTSANCTNEGFPHPRNCSICICPAGYGGTLCDRRPPGCGEDLVATDKKKTVAYRLGFGTGLRDHFSFCNYRISAPEGKKIEVDVRSISPGYYDSGCPEGGVEIKAQEDQKLTGYRFCSVNGSHGPIVSSSNPLPVILFNRRGTMQTIFSYRYI